MADPLPTFERLRILNWRQFASVDIEFHPRLTVITGANGAGKSTLLNILSRHLGAERPYLSTPKRDENGVISYLAGQFSSYWSKIFRWEVEKPATQIGELAYSDGKQTQITVPTGVGVSYGIDLPKQARIFGVPIGSHRLLSQHQVVEHISFVGISPKEVFGRFLGEAQHRYLGAFSGNSLIYQIKIALASWAAVGEGNSVIQADAAQKKAYAGFVDILKAVLPDSLGFQTLSIRPPDVVLVTNTGDFTIDAASGGLTTIIEVAALIYACSLRAELEDNKNFVVTIDEPENHLHPSLQRSLFPSLVKAFPQVQFIVATHSPFVVSSLRDSSVFVLRYHHIETDDKSESDRIVSEKLDYTSRAGSASEVLREVLGLETTLPTWVESDLQRLVQKYQASGITAASIESLRADLRSAGLSELFPEALAGLSKGQ